MGRMFDLLIFGKRCPETYSIVLPLLVFVSFVVFLSLDFLVVVIKTPNKIQENPAQKSPSTDTHRQDEQEEQNFAIIHASALPTTGKSSLHASASLGFRSAAIVRTILLGQVLVAHLGLRTAAPCGASNRHDDRFSSN